MKRVIFSLLSVALILCLSGCAKRTMITVSDGKGGFVQVEDKSDEKKAKAKIGDISNDICEEFTPDFIYSVLHKPIVRVEPSPLADVFACDYYTDYKPDYYKDAKYNFVGAGGPNISIVLDNLNVERQKKAREYLGLTLGSSEKINMENIISYRKDNSIWSVDLVINPDRFVWANYSNKAITDDELITLAAAMADKIQGRLKINIEKNPVDLDRERENILGESQEKIVSQFFENLSGKNIADALAMMDADEGTKQGWNANFSTIETLRVVKIEQTYKEEWTPVRQVFKAELDVKVKPEGEQMGWNQGANSRWVTLQKNENGQWMVHEIANNP